MVNHSKKTMGLVDNDPFALSALSHYLQTALPDMRLLWSVGTGRAAVTRCADRRSCPAVLLVDMSMGDMDGLMTTRAIRERNGTTTIIAMTSFPLDEYAQEAALAGAQTIVRKKNPKEVAEIVITMASEAQAGKVAGIQFDTAKAAFERLSSGERSGISRLTKKEITIIDLCRCGKTSAQIAEELGISAVTVNKHIQMACEKLGAKNRIQLVSDWIELGRPHR